MTRAGCKVSFLLRAQESLGRRLPLFGASKMTPSDPGWTNYSTRRSFDKNVKHICCAAFLKLVSFQAHSQHHKGLIHHCCGCLGDMWRARVLFWGAPLPAADQLRVFLSTRTVGSFVITMVNFKPSMPHPRRRREFQSPEYCTRFNILPSRYTIFTPPSTTGTLQVQCRISSNLWCSG